MDKILIVTPNPDGMKDLVDGFKDSPDVDIQWAETGEKALEMAASATPDLAIIDERIGDMDALTVINDLIRVNAMINTVAISSLPEEEFHEKSEGLGIMAQLQPSPPRSAGSDLLARLKSIKNLFTAV